MTFRERFNQGLDRAVRPELWLLRRKRSMFRVCGYTGLVCAVALAFLLCAYQHLELWVMAAIVLSSIGVFFVIGLITKIVTGREALVYYHHEIGVTFMTALLVSLLNRPVLPYLDATLLGIGAFLACGRIGCLMVGCCHGRPHPWGVCYRESHAAAGFPEYYVRVRLFPVQAVEAVWVFCIVVTGSLMIIQRQPAGSAFSWYVIAYGTGRFFLEFMRGDAVRPYYAGFSENQWVSVILMVGTSLAELSSQLPFQSWHLGICVVFSLLMIGLTLQRRSVPISRFQLLHPYHIRELAVLLREFQSDYAPGKPRSEIALKETSLGIRISFNTSIEDGNLTNHYAFSERNLPMSLQTARLLSALILRLDYRSNSGHLVVGQQSIFHFFTD